MRASLHISPAALLKTFAGAVLYAVGFQFFMYPNSIVTGGVTGIAMIINFLTGLPVGAMTMVINIPLFLFSWKRFGGRFLLMSLIGMILASVLVDVFSTVSLEITSEPLLGAVYGGIFHGAGMGIIYHAGATTGGIDIVAKALRRKYPYVNFSTFVLALDAVILVAFAVIFSRYDSAMYAIICMFISTKAVDFVLYGAVNSKVCYIITDESRAIKDAIVCDLKRGVTFLHGEGAGSGMEKDVILCVSIRNPFAELKRIVKELDESAFVIVSDSREVFGRGFEYIDDSDSVT